MNRLRDYPPAALAGLAVTLAEDLSKSTEELPPTDGLRYHLAGNPTSGVASARVIVRPSGTEPKLKCYLEVVRAVPPGADGLPAARKVHVELRLGGADSYPSLVSITFGRRTSLAAAVILGQI